MRYTPEENQAMDAYVRDRQLAWKGDHSAVARVWVDWAAGYGEHAKVLNALIARLKARPWYVKAWDWWLAKIGRGDPMR